MFQLQPPAAPIGPDWERWKQQQALQGGNALAPQFGGGIQPGVPGGGGVIGGPQFGGVPGGGAQAPQMPGGGGGTVTPRGGWGAYGGLNQSSPPNASSGQRPGTGPQSQYGQWGRPGGGLNQFGAPYKPGGGLGQQPPNRPDASGTSGSILMGGNNPYLRGGGFNPAGTAGVQSGGQLEQEYRFGTTHSQKPSGRTGGGTITQQAGQSTFDQNYAPRNNSRPNSVNRSPAEQLQAQGRIGGTGNDIKRGPLHQQGIGGYSARPREAANVPIASGHTSFNLETSRPIENEQRRNQFMAGQLPEQQTRSPISSPERQAALNRTGGSQPNARFSRFSGSPQAPVPGSPAAPAQAQAPAWQDRHQVPQHLQRPGVPAPPPAPVSGPVAQVGQVHGQMSGVQGPGAPAGQFNPAYQAGPQQQANVNQHQYNPNLQPQAQQAQQQAQAPAPAPTQPGSAAPGGGGLLPSNNPAAPSAAATGIPGPPPGFPTDGMAPVSTTINAKNKIYDKGLTQRQVNQAVAKARQLGHARTALKKGMGRGMSIDEGQVSGFALPTSAMARSAANQAMANIPLQNEFANRQYQLQGEAARGKEAIGLANVLRQIHQTNENDQISRDRLRTQQMASLISPLFANLLGGLS